MSTPREIFERLLRGVTEQRWSELPDLYAEDAEVDMPFAPGGAHIAGRDAIRAHFAAAASGPLEFSARDVVVHETADPEVVVAEYDYEGRVATTGRRFRVANVQVLRVRAGRIISSRDYHDHRALAEALR